jgi:hypothetical protein
VIKKITPKVIMLYSKVRGGNINVKLAYMSGGKTLQPTKKPITAPNPEADKTYSR